MPQRRRPQLIRHAGAAASNAAARAAEGQLHLPRRDGGIPRQGVHSAVMIWPIPTLHRRQACGIVTRCRCSRRTPSGARCRPCGSHICTSGLVTIDVCRCMPGKQGHKRGGGTHRQRRAWLFRRRRCEFVASLISFGFFPQVCHRCVAAPAARSSGTRPALRIYCSRSASCAFSRPHAQLKCPGL